MRSDAHGYFKNNVNIPESIKILFPHELFGLVFCVCYRSWLMIHLFFYISQLPYFSFFEVIGIIKRKALIKDLAALYHAECLTYCQELLELQKKWDEVRNTAFLFQLCIYMLQFFHFVLYFIILTWKCISVKSVKSFLFNNWLDNYPLSWFLVSLHISCSDLSMCGL